ncbi:alpha/beta hydrolase fold domain-containing protein [Thioclava pacifica]|uniref:Alpha/beta hydrolase fold-3 domain-containing protein n=1 Tax=Thioclava pacifica DSM 10166 TaxID=1353537 RepID=A0A074J8Q5_9RHOB|nr:alpha/beta hydrolase fold domain-containing protein [Thioclava pacifica]KEO52944.1 hypothetical protein TP2_08370 [Thioclava pacifica DSM 10166]
MSIRLTYLNAWLRIAAKPMVRRFRDPVATRREMERMASWVVREPKGLCLLQTRLGERPALSLRVGPTAQGAVILYFHGGGYVAGSPWMYRGLAARLAQLSGLEVVAPDYRLAPEAPFPAALEDAEAGFDALIAAGYEPGCIVLAGDSAGGGLALSLLGRLCGQGRAPAGVIAFSPWTDLTCSGASLRTNAKRDALLPVERIGDTVDLVLQGHPASDPEASPLFATFPNAPPVLIQHSMTEILADDALRMADRLRAFDAEVTVQSWPDAPHVWQFFDGRVPEARAALEDAAKAARAMLNLPAR